MIKSQQLQLNFNLVRHYACISVVFLHVLAQFTSRDILIQGVNALTILIDNSVELFVLLSGILLIKRESITEEFFRKRISRIGKPIIFWILVYTLLRISIKLKFGDNSFNEELINIFGINGSPYYHLWYVYLLIILYVITPFFSFLVHKSNSIYLVLYSSIIYMFWYFSNYSYFEFILLYFLGGITSKFFSRRIHIKYLLPLTLILIFINYNKLDFQGFEVIKSYLKFFILLNIPIITLSSNKILDIRNTFGIYLIHPLIIYTTIQLSTSKFFFNFFISSIFIYILTSLISNVFLSNKFLRKLI